MCKMETWLLEDYAEGLLGVAETTLLEAHLAVCEDCRRELSHIKLLFWELESMRREPIPVPEALDGLENAILESMAGGKGNLASTDTVPGQKGHKRDCGAAAEAPRRGPGGRAGRGGVCPDGQMDGTKDLPTASAEISSGGGGA
jgi:anti-sigma factor RsiW